VTGGWWLLARARHTTRAVAALVVLAVLEAIVGSASLDLLGQNITLAIPWAVIIPVAAAAVIGIGTRSAVGDTEATTTRSLPSLRAAHLAVVAAVGLVTTAVGGSGLTGPISGPAALRNYLGFTGLALLSASVVGSSLAWPLPVALAVASTTVGADQGVRHGWAWPIHDNGDPTSFLVAVAILLVRAGLFVLGGDRNPRTERD